MTAAEGPDGAVFAAPQDPTSPAPAVAWVVDGNGPAAVAEHVDTGIAALAADGNNFYAATYSTVYAYDRASGNQDGQWNMPPVNAANSSDDDLVAMAAAGGNVCVSVTTGNTVSVYRINPGSSAGPHLVVRRPRRRDRRRRLRLLRERRTTNSWRLRPNGTTVTGPGLAHTPNGLGGGVQYVNAVAGGAVWVDEPAGQGLDALFTTYDAGTLATRRPTPARSPAPSSTRRRARSCWSPAGAPRPARPPAPPRRRRACSASTTTAPSATPSTVGAAVTLIGPGPAVVVSDTSTGQFDLVRLS